jgi:hypothetical protein
VTAKRLGLRLEVGPDDYPDADAVVLLDEMSRNVDPQRHQTIARHHILKVLRGRGEDLAYVRLRVPGGTNLQIAARTRNTRGKIVPLQGSDFHRQRMRSHDPFSSWSSEIVSFTFPAVGAGAILEYTYMVTVENELLADVHLFDDDAPVQLARYILGHPADETYQTWTDDPRPGHAVSGTKTSGTDLHGRTQVVEVYEARDLAAVPDEALALVPLTARARLFVVNTKTTISLWGSGAPWDRLAMWLHRVQEGYTGEIEKQRIGVQAALRAAVTPEDKAETVLRYLRSKLRIETEQDVSDRSRTIEEVFASGVVEPFEFCILLSGLLREASLPAYLGMVNSRDALDLDPRVPWSGFFDRAVVAVFLKGRTLYFDPLTPDVAFGMPRADIQGRKMVVATQTGAQRASDLPTAKAEFADVPVAAPDDNTIERRTRLKLDRGGMAALHLEQTLSGEFACEVNDRIKTLGREEPRLAAAVEVLRLIPDADPARVTLEYSARSARVAADVSTATLVLESPAGPALDLERLGSSRLLSRLVALDLERRLSGIDLEQPQQFRAATTIELPPGGSVKTLPAAVKVDGPGLAYSASVRRTPGGIERSSTLTVRDPRIERSELPALAAFLREVMRAEQAVIPIALPGR